jgi:hypothetical protein
MQEPVENRRGEDLVVEDFAPVGKALVAGDNEAAALVPPDQEPEEETGFLAREREVAELVEDQQPRIRELLERAIQPVLVGARGPGGP